MSGGTSLDKALAIRVSRGDEKAFEEFFREYFPRLFRFVLSRTDGDEALAEEVVQRTLCQVMYKLDTYRGDAPLFTWLCTACRHEMSSHFRKTGREETFGEPDAESREIQEALESMTGPAAGPETEQQQADLARLVGATLETLPANYASALEWKYMQELSVSEIGRRLGIGEKAAESVLSRARNAFREGFEALWGHVPRLFVDE